MKRIFGGSKQATPGPTMEEATASLDGRANTLNEKIRKLDQELMGYRTQMSKFKPGTGPHNNLKQRALKVLKQKKMYEGQRDQLMNQSFNMEQASFATQTMKDTVTTISAMKTANTELKKQFKTVKIDDIENLQDEMFDLMETTNEIQETLGRSYDVGEVDESELDDELAALGDELDMEASASYLNESALPSPGQSELDPYGRTAAATTI
eukprot:TRINITY_DN427_c0_g1_i1.p1 TRINITY_DN427_c0_g1~~TRINITY_DN427_c0_g1_i1.p1  ORF type:complete len:210 (-),score=66.09 TRINITY_DN427_c0_g1_i1:47-676(-)